MKSRAILAATFLASLISHFPEQVQARNTVSSQELPAKWTGKTIPHKDIVAIKEIEPKTPLERSAFDFKPQILIKVGCATYPVVNEQGDISGGLAPSGEVSSKCRGSGHGSQIYGRATWFNERWVIMYMWYFPKVGTRQRVVGKRHNFEYVVIFLNNPAVPNPEILGCSASNIAKRAPCPASCLDGKSLKVVSKEISGLYNVNITSEKDDSQKPSIPLVMWETLSPMARKGLSSYNFDEDVPIIDKHFYSKIRESWPFP
ncbi:hypothetical protein CCR75_006874 [Bremia lactucae]|uniref:Necrosis inducing protein NPP1 n=1 Tax=Bremia lactucae TaxID=4779 RepID=A0A976ILE0_BRELC|nr:hypothetical protein CCR75_006874 [Bremia lactucae]